ncbi:hypothetical protein NKJ06_31955 [Mesorhizobium sp. M0293]|uniref:hypothetical protein n=1 Tax=unclassified Mesorhizobium TaxID=325217 RepID=UPI00333A6A44
MANIRSTSCGCTTSFVPIFDVGSSSKARSKARITKVSQTNIDEMLVGFFWRAVKSAWTMPAANRRHDGRTGTPGQRLLPPTRKNLRHQKIFAHPGTICAKVHLLAVVGSS